MSLEYDSETLPSPPMRFHTPWDLWALWADLICKYARWKLTRTEDKLNAFAGIAECLSVFSPFHPNKYLAGLWDGEHVVHQLLWCTGTRHPRNVRQPSWSWSDVDSDIRVRITIDILAKKRQKFCQVFIFEQT